ncbi:VirD4-like conjugal transfer protein, CD1115 family [Clostridium estertheticum]|uniref:VirD4-like conjugal transfer protein, CD1115 family n=1 Tax=Clostridium estertheticum TaxID=238834 RepID=UPI001C7D0328|nr:type IV secretory system conjugative DNA transfer family protein [Clostridium estertheticum]MBX4272068.1 type IV secretory system conjugative DNA transfer family protein [Clostridium estertheticum]WLC82436.1 type IV secretory system conjugative DNA transfer family protein [Clostridium estertheticum]
MYKTPQEKANRKKKGKIKSSAIMTLALMFIFENFLHGYLITGSLSKMNEYLATKMTILWLPNDWRYLILGLVMIIIYALYAAIVWADSTISMNPHEQKGSSKFLEYTSLKKFEDKDITKNVILSKNVKMSMNNRKTERNNNLCVFGSAGAGKTFKLISPNLLNVGNENLVCNDVKGEIIIMHGKQLKEKGYDVRCLNTKNMEKSLRFNPMNYINKESDILSIAKILSESLNSGKTGGDAFWDSAKENLITACMGYLWLNKKNNPEMCNLPAINDLLRSAEEEFDEKGFSMGSEFDRKMARFSNDNPSSLCARAYGNFKQSTDKTRSNIILTLQNMLSCLDIQEARDLFSGEDELKLWELATEEKIAIFLCSSDTDSTWGWITTLAIALGLNVISNIRDENPDKGVDVIFWLDEFANGSRIRDCDKIVAVCRSRRIHMKIILQSIVQLQKLYEKEWEAIIENCDTILSLGSQGKTAKWLSEALGKTGLDTTSSSASKQTKGGSSSINSSIESRNLMDAAEIERLDKECIIKIRGEQPVIDEKYQTNLDKRFKLMGDVRKGHSDEKNYFFEPTEYRNSKALETKGTNVNESDVCFDDV